MPSLTDLAIRNASPGATLWDSALRGFGVRVGKQTKTFIVLVDSGRRHAIGHYPLISLSEARTEAKRILAEKTLGKTKPRFLAFEDARTRFLADVKLRPSTLAGYRSRLNRVSWGRSNLADITPRDVLKQLSGFSGDMEKRYAFVTLRRFFNWCVEQHLIDQAPTEKLATPEKNDSRDRVLTPDELAAIDGKLERIEAYFNPHPATVEPKTRKPRATGTRKPRKAGVRDEVLAKIAANPDGIKAADLIEAMGGKDNKAVETSIRNAVNALKKDGKISADKGHYKAL